MKVSWLKQNGFSPTNFSPFVWTGCVTGFVNWVCGLGVEDCVLKTGCMDWVYGLGVWTGCVD